MVKYFDQISFNLFLNIFILFDFCINKVPIFDLSNKQKHTQNEKHKHTISTSKANEQCRNYCNRLYSLVFINVIYHHPLILQSCKTYQTSF